MRVRATTTTALHGSASAGTAGRRAIGVMSPRPPIEECLAETSDSTRRSRSRRRRPGPRWPVAVLAPGGTGSRRSGPDPGRQREAMILAIEKSCVRHPGEHRIGQHMGPVFTHTRYDGGGAKEPEGYRNSPECPHHSALRGEMPCAEDGWYLCLDCGLFVKRN